jgi:hypothetical protein
MASEPTAGTSGNFVRKLPGRIWRATLFYLDFLHMVARGQNLSARFVGNGRVGNQTIIEGVLPGLWLGRQARADLPVAIESA